MDICKKELMEEMLKRFVRDSAFLQVLEWWFKAPLILQYT